jgi:hypothetical protein
MDLPGALFQKGTPNLLVISGEGYGRNWGHIFPLAQHIILIKIDSLRWKKNI